MPQTAMQAPSVNLKTEVLLAKAMILLGVESLEITQEDMQNARTWILGLAIGPGECKATLRDTSIKQEPEFKCVLCGAPSCVDPSDQTPPSDYCHESDHGEPDWPSRVEQSRRENLPLGCHRAHPHENMGAECQALTDRIRASYQAVVKDNAN